MTHHHLLAVALATIGAALFGLSAVRQSLAVQQTVGRHGHGLRHQLHDLVRLARHRSWLTGTVQGIVGGAAHVLALALAPISLVQPIGVLAVPVGVVASAVRHRRRPRATEALGAVASVAAIATLTILLLQPPQRPPVLPSWTLLTGIALAIAAATALAARLSTRGPALLRCVVRSAGAAVLFGLGSVLIRTVGQLLVDGRATAELPLVVGAVVAFGVTLSVGLWAMQTAYLTGSSHVVLCCLTLLDPVTAVLLGHLLLGDGAGLGGPRLVGAGICAVVAGLGVVLLARSYPSGHPEAEPSPVPATAHSGGPLSGS